MKENFIEDIINCGFKGEDVRNIVYNEGVPSTDRYFIIEKLTKLLE